MKQALRVLICTFLLASSQFLSAQISINSTNPDAESMTICGDSAEISFVVLANGTSATGIGVEIQMPEGIHYVGNTLRLTSAGSKAVTYSSWNNQVLSLTAGDLSASDSLAFAFQFYADCEVLSYFQNTVTFRDTLTMTYNGSSQAQHITQALNSSITYPQLSVLIPSIPSGSLGEVISRDVKLFNAQGCIRGFDWFDIAGSDVQIDSVYLAGNKLDITRSGDTVSYRFSGDDFLSIGNGDSAFCVDELSFTITEYLTLTGCNDKNSEIMVSWGCGGTSCQSYSANTDVSIAANNPELSFSWRYNELPACFHEQANYKEVLIQNIGDGTATQIELEIKKFYYGGQFSEYKYDGIDTSTIVMKVGNGSFAKYTAYNVELNYDHVSCSENYVYRCTVAPPDLEPGDSAVVGFYVVNCDPNEATINSDIRQGAMGYNFRFQNACQNNLTTGWNKVGIPYKQLTSSIVATSPLALLEDDQGIIETTIQTASISYGGDGQFSVQYVLPSCGISFSGNSSDLYWTNSGENLTWSPSSFQVSNDTITASFEMGSMPSGFSYSGSMMRLLVSGSCGCTGSSAARVVSHLLCYVPEISCATPLPIKMYEEDFSINIDLCNNNPCDGPRLSSFSFDRISYGMADDGFSRQPDFDDPIDLDTIRMDRARYGDTLQASFVAYIDGVDTFSNGYAELTLDLPQYISPVGGSFRLYKQSSGTYLQSDTLFIGQSDSATYQFYFSPDTLAPYAAAFRGVVFEPGDTLFCSPMFRVSGEGTQSQTMLTISPANLYVQASPADTNVQCGSTVYADQIQLIKMEDQTATNYLLSNSCEETWARTYIRQYVANDKTDIFFGEYRTWNHPDTIYVTPPDNFDFVDAYLLLRFNPIVKDAYLSPLDSTANPLVFPVNDLFDDDTFLEPDDGYELQFLTIWQPNCNAPNDSAIEVPVRVSYVWSSPLEETYAAEGNYTAYVRHKAPNLQMSNINSSIQDGLTNMVEWKVRVQNKSLDSKAPNPWFGLEIPSGKISIDQVYDETNAAVLTGSNGIYALTEFSEGEYRDYTIMATYTSCSQDSLKFHLGWSCEGVPASISAYPCTANEYDLVLNPIPSAAFINLQQIPDTLSNLCSSEEFIVNISSSLVANVNDLQLDIYYPSGGLVAEPGSFEIEYPSGSGYTSISDPDTIDGGYRISFSSYDSLLSADGLHGLWSSYDSMRMINLRFDMVSNCDFISGDIMYMILNGEKPCGEAIDAYFMPTSAILLDGVTVPYTSNIELELPTVEGCGNTVDLKTSITIEDGTTTSSEKIWVTLPTGLGYHASEFSDIHNGPNSGSFTTEDLGALGTRLIWDMPSGVTNGDSVVFEIGIYAEESTDCSSNSEIIKANVVFNTSVACGGQTCTGFQAASGSAASSATFSKPELVFEEMLNEVSISGIETEYKISGRVTNYGADMNARNYTIVEIYADQNNNNLLESETDTLLSSTIQKWDIDNGQSEVFSETIRIQNSPIDPNAALLLTLEKEADTLGVTTQCFCDSISISPVLDVVLPIEWGDFHVRNENRVGALTWTTLQETNSSHFVIQRSIDQENYMDIGQIKAERDRDTISSYSFLDKSLQEIGVSTVFYRIQQVDLDGAYSYSQVKRLNIEQSSRPLTVFAYPNPAKHSINVRCIGSQAETQLQIVSSLGQVMIEQTVKKEFWDQVQSFEVQDWPGGVYIVRISTEQRESMYKFVVK